MKVISYYKDVPDRSKYHFLDWITNMGEALPKEIGDAKLVKLDALSYDIDDGEYDIAYCPMFYFPNRRPKCFVYSFLSDYKGYEGKVKDWLSRVRPDLLCMLQQMPQDLVDYANKIGCRVELVPWFVLDRKPYLDKEFLGMCSGCIDPKQYPGRRAVYDYLAAKKFDGVTLSGGPFGKYPLSNEKYIEHISKTKYYMSGGIYDSLIPPKYYEVCNYGCALICRDMPFMERCGFIDGKTYIRIERPEEIEEILKTDAWLEIGKNAQKMVHENHTVAQRAAQILDVYYGRR